MAPHSSTLAWKIPWTEEPGRLQSMRSLRLRTRLSDFTVTFHFHALEKEMATHSSVLAWRIPGMGEPGALPSMGSQSRTRLKRLSSSSPLLYKLVPYCFGTKTQWVLDVEFDITWENSGGILNHNQNYSTGKCSQTWWRSLYFISEL